jgi:hypothetical protein
LDRDREYGESAIGGRSSLRGLEEGQMTRVLMWLVIALLLTQTAGCGSGSSTKSPEPPEKKVIRELREAEPSTTPQAREAAERANLHLPAAYAAKIEAVCNRFEARLLPLTDANATGRGPSRSTLASGRPLRATFLAQIQSIAVAAGARGMAFSHSVEALLHKEIAWSEAYPVSPSRLSSLEGHAAETNEAWRKYEKKRLAAGIGRCNF